MQRRDGSRKLATQRQPRQDPVRRETLIGIWIGGLVLAALIYLVGPDQFLDTVLNAFDAIDYVFRHLVFNLGVQLYTLIRALTIALYIVFVVLALMAVSRGRPGIWALIVVTVLCMLLVWRPYSDFPVAPGRWIVAFAIVLLGAVMMTQRLMTPPRQERWPPFPPRPPA